MARKNIRLFPTQEALQERLAEYVSKLTQDKMWAALGLKKDSYYGYCLADGSTRKWDALFDEAVAPFRESFIKRIQEELSKPKAQDALIRRVCNAYGNGYIGKAAEQRLRMDAEAAIHNAFEDALAKIQPVLEKRARAAAQAAIAAAFPGGVPSSAPPEYAEDE